jgi:hypothetical protein
MILAPTWILVLVSLVITAIFAFVCKFCYDLGLSHGKDYQ